METEAHQSDIPIWYGGTQRWMTGLTKRTTCDDVIYALLYSNGLQETESTDNYAIFEKWREVERPLSARTKIMKVWGFWGEEQPNVQLSMRSLDDYFLPGDSSLYMRSRRRHKNVSRHRSRHASHCRCHNRRGCMECSRLRTLEQLVKLVVSQERKIQNLSDRLRDTDRLIDKHETKIHQHRVQQNGLDYVQNSYLNSHSSDSSSTSMDSAGFGTLTLKQLQTVFTESSSQELEEIARTCEDISLVERRLAAELTTIEELSPELDRLTSDMGVGWEEATDGELQSVRMEMVRAVTSHVTQQCAEKEVVSKTSELVARLQRQALWARELTQELTDLDAEVSSDPEVSGECQHYQLQHVSHTDTEAMTLAATRPTDPISQSHPPDSRKLWHPDGDQLTRPPYYNRPEVHPDSCHVISPAATPGAQVVSHVVCGGMGTGRLGLGHHHRVNQEASSTHLQHSLPPQVSPRRLTDEGSLANGDVLYQSTETQPSTESLSLQQSFRNNSVFSQCQNSQANTELERSVNAAKPCQDSDKLFKTPPTIPNPSRTRQRVLDQKNATRPRSKSADRICRRGSTERSHNTGGVHSSTNSDSVRTGNPGHVLCKDDMSYSVQRYRTPNHVDDTRAMSTLSGNPSNVEIRCPPAMTGGSAKHSEEHSYQPELKSPSPNRSAMYQRHERRHEQSNEQIYEQRNEQIAPTFPLRGLVSGHSVPNPINTPCEKKQFVRLGQETNSNDSPNITTSSNNNNSSNSINNSISNNINSNNASAYMNWRSRREDDGELRNSANTQPSQPFQPVTGKINSSTYGQVLLTNGREQKDQVRDSRTENRFKDVSMLTEEIRRDVRGELPYNSFSVQGNTINARAQSSQSRNTRNDLPSKSQIPQDNDRLGSTSSWHAVCNDEEKVGRQRSFTSGDSSVRRGSGSGSGAAANERSLTAAGEVSSQRAPNHSQIMNDYYRKSQIPNNFDNALPVPVESAVSELNAVGACEQSLTPGSMPNFSTDHRQIPHILSASTATAAGEPPWVGKVAFREAFSISSRPWNGPDRDYCTELSNGSVQTQNRLGQSKSQPNLHYESGTSNSAQRRGEFPDDTSSSRGALHHILSSKLSYRNKSTENNQTSSNSSRKGSHLQMTMQAKEMDCQRKFDGSDVATTTTTTTTVNCSITTINPTPSITTAAPTTPTTQHRHPSSHVQSEWRDCDPTPRPPVAAQPGANSTATSTGNRNPSETGNKQPYQRHQHHQHHQQLQHQKHQQHPQHQQILKHQQQSVSERNEAVAVHGVKLEAGEMQYANSSLPSPSLPPPSSPSQSNHPCSSYQGRASGGETNQFAKSHGAPTAMNGGRRAINPHFCDNTLNEGKRKPVTPQPTRAAPKMFHSGCSNGFKMNGLTSSQSSRNRSNVSNIHNDGNKSSGKMLDKINPSIPVTPSSYIIYSNTRINDAVNLGDILAQRDTKKFQNLGRHVTDTTGLGPGQNNAAPDAETSKLEESNDSNSDTGLSSMHSDETTNMETLV